MTNLGMNDPMAIGIGVLTTMTVLSYLYKDNFFYRIAQKAAMGGAVGVGIVFIWQNVLGPMWGYKIWTALRGEAHFSNMFWILMLIPGILFYFQMSKKYFYLSRPVIALFVGTAAGLAFKNQVNAILPQVAAVMSPINPWADGVGWGIAINNIIVLVCFFCTLLYFSFTIKSEGRLFTVPMAFGRLTIMVALGAMFGNTVMTRMAFLIERIQFLFDQFMVLLNFVMGRG